MSTRPSELITVVVPTQPRLPEVRINLRHLRPDVFAGRAREVTSIAGFIDKNGSSGSAIEMLGRVHGSLMAPTLSERVAYGTSSRALGGRQGDSL